jgi:hypothetical protein
MKAWRTVSVFGVSLIAGAFNSLPLPPPFSGFKFLRNPSGIQSPKRVQHGIQRYGDH